MYVYMIVSCVYVHVVDVRSYNVRIHMDGQNVDTCGGNVTRCATDEKVPDRCKLRYVHNMITIE